MSLALRQTGGLAEIEDEGREVDVVPASTYGTIIRSEIEAQVATAHRYPRSIRKFKDTAVALATLSRAVAESCIYALPRGGKTINGPSVRLAEILASCYGNLRVLTRVTDQDDRHVTVTATCLDTENNYGVSIEVKRRVTDRNGKTYNDDMIAVTIAAATSIAYRNAVFKVIPNAFRDVVYAEAKHVAAGKGDDFASTRDGWLAYFADHGIPAERVFDGLGVRGADDMTLEHVTTLIGIYNRIEDGSMTAAQAFPATVQAPAPAEGSKSQQLAAKLKGTGRDQPPEPGSDG